ncbi:MAG: SOS response-associated peptidase [Gammaproteobacteria bacterium]
MCGRYANHVKQMGQWTELLDDWPEDAELGYNIAPTQMVPAFTAEHGLAMRWGMVPPWSKEPNSKYATFNARAESVADKPAFRHAWNKSQTCLVPAIGYYEWQGAKGNKQPFFIRPQNQEPLVMAGLWERWRQDDQSLYSCTVITQPSYGKLEKLHSRMPLMLELGQAEQWLNDGVSVLDQLLSNQNTERFEYYPVDKSVNRSTNEGEQLIAPITLAANG